VTEPRANTIVGLTPLIAATFVIGVGVCVLVGWCLDSLTLEGGWAGLPTMKVNSALALLLGGLSLLATRWQGRIGSAGWICGAGMTAIALLTVCEYIFGWNLGIDEAIFRDFTSRPGMPTGRMALSTASSLVLVGPALVLCHRRRSRRAIQALVFTAAWIAFLSFAGYVYGSPVLSRLGPFESMAPNTTVTLLALCTGILFAMPEDGLVAALRLPGLSGRVARRLIPPALVVPLVLGWLGLQGQHLGWYGTEFGIAILVVSTILVLGLLIWWSVNSLADLEAAQARSHRELRSQSDALRRQAQLIDLSNDAIIIADTRRVITGWNGGAEKLYGWKEAEAIGQVIHDFLQTVSPVSFQEMDNVLGRKYRWDGELVHTRRDGRKVTVDSHQVLLQDAGGEPGGILEINRDISDRKHLEEQLLQSQKLESVGQLAGGVAHDFNNLLTVINGYSIMALDELPADHGLRELIEEICKAGDRAASLTRQLLTFSRRQVRSLSNFVLNDSVLDLEKMLRRLIGEDVELILSLDPDPAVIRNDRGHVEQVLMNLAINARDAMPKGGKLVIETSHATVDELYAEVHFGLVQGSYAMLIVSDTGEGMSPEVKARIFEPFYTTKEQGKGTGLGLSTVYGIVKQSEGAILVYTEPGKGTTFKILFPAVDASVDPAQPVVAPGDLRGTETILVVEDEEGLQKYVREVLEQRGYTVVTSTNGRDALDEARRFQGPIHLLLTDVVMPKMGGIDLGEDFAALRPGVPVLHMSGYTDRLWKSSTTPNFIQKPFTPTALLTEVRRLLGPG